MPGQLVFGQDMIFNIKYIANWETIQWNKQAIIAKNNKAENMKRIKYDNKINQKVMIEPQKPNKMMSPYEGPYTITTVWNNGTITVHKATKHGAIYEWIDIQRAHPYNN